MQGKAQGTWSELAAKIKVAQAQRLYLHGNRKLTLEILDLMSRLEKIAQVRYASGLAAQQDVIRAQVEQTNMRSELVTLDAEARQVNARLNALLARPASAPLAEPTLDAPWPAPAQLDVATLEERVRNRNPQLFVEEARVKSAEKGRELAYKNRYPDFMVGIQPTQYQTSFKEWTPDARGEHPAAAGIAARPGTRVRGHAGGGALRARRPSPTRCCPTCPRIWPGIEAARRIEALATTSLLPQAELTFNSALAGYENSKVDFATLLDAQRARSARPGKTRSRPGSRGRSGWPKSKNCWEKNYEAEHWTGVSASSRSRCSRQAAATGWATRGRPPWPLLARAQPWPARARRLATPAKQEKKLLYYRNPMGLPDTSPSPEEGPDGHGLHRRV